MIEKEERVNHIAIQNAETVIQAANTPYEREKSPVVAGSATDTGMTTVIGWVLQGGVTLSSLNIVIGFVLLLITPGTLSLHLNTFPHTLQNLWTTLLVGSPLAIIVLGLLLLIATPVMRVATSILAFRSEE